MCVSETVHPFSCLSFLLTVKHWEFNTYSLHFLVFLLQIVDVSHPGRANVPKVDIKKEIAKLYSVSDDKTIFLFGFKTSFGGAKSSGFCLIYDSLDSALDSLPKYHLVRAGFTKLKESSRKLRRELKNRKKKVRGTAKAKIGGGN